MKSSNILILLLIVVLATVCGGVTSSDAAPKKLVSIAVTPTNPSIVLGTTEQFTATGTYSDNSTRNLTTSVTWSSSAKSVATISNAGKIKRKGHLNSCRYDNDHGQIREDLRFDSSDGHSARVDRSLPDQPEYYPWDDRAVHSHRDLFGQQHAGHHHISDLEFLGQICRHH